MSSGWKLDTKPLDAFIDRLQSHSTEEFWEWIEVDVAGRMQRVQAVPFSATPGSAFSVMVRTVVASGDLIALLTIVDVETKDLVGFHLKVVHHVLWLSVWVAPQWERARLMEVVRKLALVGDRMEFRWSDGGDVW